MDNKNKYCATCNFTLNSKDYAKEYKNKFNKIICICCAETKPEDKISITIISGNYR